MPKLAEQERARTFRALQGRVKDLQTALDALAKDVAAAAAQDVDADPGDPPDHDPEASEHERKWVPCARCGSGAGEPRRTWYRLELEEAWRLESYRLGLNPSASPMASIVQNAAKGCVNTVRKHRICVLCRDECMVRKDRLAALRASGPNAQTWTGGQLTNQPKSAETASAYPDVQWQSPWRPWARYWRQCRFFRPRVREGAGSMEIPPPRPHAPEPGLCSPGLAGNGCADATGRPLNPMVPS